MAKNSILNDLRWCVGAKSARMKADFARIRPSPVRPRLSSARIRWATGEDGRERRREKGSGGCGGAERVGILPLHSRSRVRMTAKTDNGKGRIGEEYICLGITMVPPLRARGTFGCETFIAKALRVRIR